MQILKTKISLVLLVALLAITFLMPVTAFADDCKTSATPDGKNTATSSELKNCLKNNSIVTDLNIIINFLSVGVGVVVIAMIIVGGIQYSLAGDSSEAINKAKTRITNALIALVAYLFLFSFLQWIIPGGLFG